MTSREELDLAAEALADAAEVYLDIEPPDADEDDDGILAALLAVDQEEYELARIQLGRALKAFRYAAQRELSARAVNGSR